MSDFVRDLENELLAAARRRSARRTRRWSFRPLLAAVAVAAALILVTLLPRTGDSSGAPATAQSRPCSLFPDADHLLRDAPCTSDLFGQ